jgi:hypothetical protein
MKQIFGILFYSLLILLVPEAISQGDPLLRVEIETKTDKAQYRIVPCGTDGFILLYPTTIEEDEYQFWNTVFYDKFLQENWKKSIPMFKNMRYRDHFFEDGVVYLFYYVPERKKNDLYNFQVVKIRSADGTYELFSGVLPDNARTVSFHVYRETIFAGMNFEKEEAGIYSFNIADREVKTISEMTDLKSRLEHLYVDTLQPSLVALFNVYDTRTNFFMQLNTFSLDGTSVDKINISPDPGRKFNTGRIIKGINHDVMIFGTYEPLKGETVDVKNYFSKKASGFFITTISENREVTTRFEAFLDLEKMTGYLRSREFMQAKRRAERKEDPDAVSLGFNLLLHDVILYDSLFFLLAEGYFEEYHTVTNTYYDFYGRTIPFTQTIFDGYRYFNAFLTCYDFEGNKLWDNGMEIFNILSFDLKKRVNTYFSGRDVILFYNHEGKISSKIISAFEKAEGVSSYPIETTYVNDRVMTDTKSDIIPWYDNYFIAYGFQTIRNNALTNSRRTVFYMNKVELR